MPVAESIMPTKQDVVHLINPMQNAMGGSEWRTRSLYEALQPHGEVDIWSPAREVEPSLQARYAVNSFGRLRFPWGGVFVFVGTYFSYRYWWLRLARPRRIVIISNMSVPHFLDDRLGELARVGLAGRVEVAYASSLMREMMGHPGHVQPSLIDLDRFSPRPAGGGDEQEVFTVGRLSRDTPFKHHDDDAAFYRRLAEAGCRVRIMGGCSLQEALADVPGVELLPEGSEPPQDFLRSLDCFFYRTDVHHVEPHGRVVTEAMACGLPVVCHLPGGYTDFVEHEHNGFLFEAEEDAFDILMRLKDDHALRERIRRAARQRMEDLFSAEQRAELVRFYLK